MPQKGGRRFVLNQAGDGDQVRLACGEPSVLFLHTSPAFLFQYVSNLNALAGSITFPFTSKGPLSESDME